MATGFAILSEQIQTSTNTSKYRLRRDGARTWAIDRLVTKKGNQVWTPWKYGPIEAVARIFLHVSMPETEALTCYKQIVGAIAAAEGRVQHALSMAAHTPGGGELVLEL